MGGDMIQQNVTHDVNPVEGFTDGNVAYVWECAKCGVKAKRTEQLVPGDAFPRATLPAGWIRLDDCGDFICPAHKVVWFVDGEPV
jgi:hypothetical protein